VQSSSEHLLEFVSDILDLSQLESGKLELHPVQLDVIPVVRELVARHQPHVADRPLVLEAELPDGAAIATVDARRLEQILANLLSNASRFTTRGSIVVSVLVHPDTGLARAITVRDSGIGIPLERQSRIFESFDEGGQTGGTDPIEPREPGSGLGLALSWRIARHMGCALSVESTPGSGSTFTLAFHSHADGPSASRHGTLIASV
jgi:signal transduction histidine kinase